MAKNEPEQIGKMTLWDALKPVDRTFTKPITGKSYRGDSPNPTYVIRKITEQLGPIGYHWGFKVISETINEGKPHQIIKSQRIEYGNDGKTVLTKFVDYELVCERYHQVHIRFWFRNAEGNVGEFDAFGGTPMLYMTKRGDWMHDEDAAKKSLTDAYTKGASWLGACADIFLGLFDDKYSGGDETPSEPKTKTPSEPASGKRETTDPFS